MIDKSKNKTKAGAAGVKEEVMEEEVIPEEEEIMEEVIPEEAEVTINNASQEPLIILVSSTSVMEPELNTIQILTTLQKYSTSSLVKREIL